MRHRIAAVILVLGFAALTGGCAVTGAYPSNTSDGKCHGPDYNAPDCIYLF